MCEINISMYTTNIVFAINVGFMECCRATLKEVMFEAFRFSWKREGGRCSWLLACHAYPPDRQTEPSGVLSK